MDIIDPVDEKSLETLIKYVDKYECTDTPIECARKVN